MQRVWSFGVWSLGVWSLGVWSWVLVAAGSMLSASPCFAAGAVQVFILAGQSNMEGKAPNELFDHQATDGATQDFFAHLRQDGKWRVRDDVFIKFLDRHGPLTLGFGSPGRTGPELEFGHVVGEKFRDPVLLVKIAWGGRSIVKDFRSPSAGLPPREALEKELAQRQANVQKNNEKNKKSDPLPTMEELQQGYGASYRSLLAEYKLTREQYGKLFPALADKEWKLAGLVWFQGWNDQYGGQDEYASNLAHLFRDLRRDLEAPKLPIVVAAMGQNGSKPATGAMLTIQTAQLGIEKLPEFQGNVKSVRTDVLIDKAAEALYPTWRENLEQWKKTGGDHGYHYLGSAIWFTRIGRAMGEAMLELAPPQN